AGETGQAGGRQGFLPKVLSSTASDAAPVRDLIVMGLLMSLVALLTLTPDLVKQFSTIADFTVYLTLLIYALCALALIRFSGSITNTNLRWTARLLGAFAAASSAWIAWAAFAG
ncbi:MAG TPA: hypothetical protein DCY26_11650, partial [Hyphomonas sp.]|nr:hypothetical protein [Hyphomonas sp.]